MHHSENRPQLQLAMTQGSKTSVSEKTQVSSISHSLYNPLLTMNNMQTLQERVGRSMQPTSDSNCSHTLFSTAAVFSTRHSIATYSEENK